MSGFLKDFASKVRAEHASRFSICFAGSGNSELEGLDHVTAVPDSSDQLLDAVQEGYVVLLEDGKPDGLLNPGEFFRLKLPDPNTSRTYHEICFQGKNQRRQGGIIVSSDAIRYILSLGEGARLLRTGMVRTILKKTGFRPEEVTINQDSPFGERKPGRATVMEKIRLSLAWNTLFPIRESRASLFRDLFFFREHPLFRLFFAGVALSIFILLPILSLDAGLSGDDEKHYEHAIKVYRYFSEGDRSALNDPKYKLNYYGQSFDFFTYLVIRLLNLEDHPYEARHLMVALTGAAAIFFTALFVKLIAGYRGALIALVLMFLSPRFLGHSFNNPMDVPFALGNIFTLYHLALFLRKLPRFSPNHAIWMAVGIGWTNGIRIGGLLLIPYLFMFSGLYLLLRKWPWKFFSAGWWKLASRGLGILVLVSVSGYLLSLLTWPYALQDIINHPIKSFQIMTDIQVSIRVLYDGVVQWSDNLPWHYIPKNVINTVPVIILLGWFASLVTWYVDRREGNGFWYFLLWFTSIFPVLFIIYRESNVYGGWRHMLFIYPSILALAALSISSLLRKTRPAVIRYAVILLLLAGSIHPLRHVVLNHPNTYIYFNEWSGGINNTYGTFETDYYSASLKPASDLFKAEILPGLSDRAEPVKVVSNFSISYYFRNHRDRVSPSYSRYYDRGKYDWDYAILYCNYIHPYQLNNGLWPPKNTIREVRVDDVVVAAIVERKNKSDHYGSSLFMEGMAEQDRRKLEQSRNYLENAVMYNPKNEAALLELGNVYSSFLQFDKARQTMDQLLEVYPDYDKALNLKGYSYMIEAEYMQDPALIDKAIHFINLAIRSNYKFYSGYYNLGLCYGMKDDKANAEYNFRLAIKYNGRFKAAYEKLAELYEFYGETDLANQVRQQMSRLQ